MAPSDKDSRSGTAALPKDSLLHLIGHNHRAQRDGRDWRTQISSAGSNPHSGLSVLDILDEALDLVRSPFGSVPCNPPRRPSPGYQPARAAAPEEKKQ